MYVHVDASYEYDYIQHNLFINNGGCTCTSIMEGVHVPQ